MALILVVLSFLAVLIVADVLAIERCELARSLKDASMPGSLGDWVCTAYYSSYFNTNFLTYNGGQSTNNGLFQINSYYWCRDPQRPGESNICDMDCSRLLNTDINDDMACAKTIYYWQGLTAWVAYNNNCRGRDNNGWVNGCGV